MTRPLSLLQALFHASLGLLLLVSVARFVPALLHSPHATEFWLIVGMLPVGAALGVGALRLAAQSAWPSLGRREVPDSLQRLCPGCGARRDGPACATCGLPTAEARWTREGWLDPLGGALMGMFVMGLTGLGVGSIFDRAVTHRFGLAASSVLIALLLLMLAVGVGLLRGAIDRWRRGLCRCEATWRGPGDVRQIVASAKLVEGQPLDLAGHTAHDFSAAALTAELQGDDDERALARVLLALMADRHLLLRGARTVRWQRGQVASTTASAPPFRTSPATEAVETSEVDERTILPVTSLVATFGVEPDALRSELPALFERAHTPAELRQRLPHDPSFRNAIARFAARL